jgi:cell division protein FtsI/penicillin-binding protein 2
MAQGAGCRVITETRFFCQEPNFWPSFNYCREVTSLSLTEAIRHSCNVYFYNVGRRMGIDRIAESAKRLGLGDKTRIDLPGEKDGLVPTPGWSRSTRKTDWYLGETISVSIGQGPLVVTPLQVAVHTAIIANRGRAVVPHLLMSSFPAQESLSGRTAGASPAEKIRPDFFETVIGCGAANEEDQPWTKVDASMSAKRHQRWPKGGKTRQTVKTYLVPGRTAG